MQDGWGLINLDTGAEIKPFVQDRFNTAAMQRTGRQYKTASGEMIDYFGPVFWHSFFGCSVPGKFPPYWRRAYRHLSYWRRVGALPTAAGALPPPTIPIAERSIWFPWDPQRPLSQHDPGPRTARLPVGVRSQKSRQSSYSSYTYTS